MTDYDGIAQEYARLTEVTEQKTRSHFYSLLPSLREKAILDVGCGSGHDCQHYAAQGATTHGIDISRIEINACGERDCGHFVVGTMEQLPYATGTFDAVASMYALQASADVPRALEEMVRVAKEGGLITILVKHPFRNLIEGHVNNRLSDYFANRTVSSYIFNRRIKLDEPAHTMMEFLNPSILAQVTLERFEERTDFPASEQVIRGMNYPTYMIIQFRKRTA